MEINKNRQIVNYVPVLLTTVTQIIIIKGNAQFSSGEKRFNQINLLRGKGENLLK